MNDKVIVITGGSRGLGKAMALIFAKAGAKVVIIARDIELKKIAKEIGAEAINADVTDEKKIKKICDEIASKYGQIDFWINNAGVWIAHAPVENLDTKRVREIMEVNLFGTIYGSKYALIQMRKQGYGAIVNILSRSALMGRKNSSGYASTKWAARGFTESLKEELKDSGIKAVGIYPGGVKTDLYGDKKPADFDAYLDVDEVAKKIFDHLQRGSTDDLVISRPSEIRPV